MPNAPSPQPSLTTPSLTMPKSTADAAIAIGLALFVNIPVALWGAPGNGKT